MDEEDRNEFGIAPRHVQTHSEFSGQKRPRQRQYHDGPIPGKVVCIFCCAILNAIGKIIPKVLMLPN